MNEIAVHTFKDGTRMAIVESDFEKKVGDHTEKYTSYRVKYFDSNGADLQYSYVDFYRNAIKYVEYIVKSGKTIDKMAKEKIMGLIYKTYKIGGVEIDPIVEIVKSFDKVWFGGSVGDGESGGGSFLYKLLVGAHYGFYAEDYYLKYRGTKYKFGRDFNIVKYYLVLIGDTDHDVLDEDAFPSGRLSPEQASIIWNKDGTTVEEKAIYIRIIMGKIRKMYEPGYKDIVSGWE